MKSSLAQVRDLAPDDHAAWLQLWKAYCAFYEAAVAPDVTERTWHRLLDAASPIFGRAAVVEGRMAGFSMSVLHEATWSIAPACYLEDLFVDPAHRKGGVATTLIQDLIELGRAKGWSRLYWHTRAGNAAARRVYDRFGPADDFVRYRLDLGAA